MNKKVLSYLSKASAVSKFSTFDLVREISMAVGPSNCSTLLRTRLYVDPEHSRLCLVSLASNAFHVLGTKVGALQVGLLFLFICKREKKEVQDKVLKNV